jgi:hypothetical protein
MPLKIREEKWPGPRPGRFRTVRVYPCACGQEVACHVYTGTPCPCGSHAYNTDGWEVPAKPQETDR